jgi:predicted RND superfamily exporter protein
MPIRQQSEVAFERWGRTVCRHPWPIIVIMMLATAGMVAGMGKLRFEMSTEGYLDRDDPTRTGYEAFRAEFANDDMILIVLRSQKVFSFEFLEKLRRFHGDIESEVPLLADVSSLINARVTRGSGDQLIVEELLEHWPRDEAELAAVEARARANPVYTNVLLSEDGRTTTVTIKVAPMGGGELADLLGGFNEQAVEQTTPELPPVLLDKELDAVMSSLLEVVERHRSDTFPIWVTGNPEMTHALARTARTDMTLFAGLTNVIIAILLFVFFRRLSGVLLPVLVVTLPLGATLGLMGFAGLPLTPSTQQLPSLLLAVCVGDAVHILAIFYRRLDAGGERHEAIVHALGHSGLAVVMTSLTTAGGLGSFIFADLAPIAGLGIAAPAGVMMALVHSTVLLPALLAVLPIRPRRGRQQGQSPSAIDRGLAALGDVCTSRPWWTVSAWCVLVGAAVYGIFQLELSYKPLEWFPRDHPSRVAAELANRELRAVMPLEVVLDTGETEGLHDPEFLRRVEALEQFALGVEAGGIAAGQAISLVDILKETNQALNENDPAQYVVPDDAKLIAQEFLLFENSGSDDLEQLVDRSFRKTRLSVLVSYDDGLRYLDFVREIERGADEIIAGHAVVETTGLVKLWVRSISALTSSTAKSYAVAILAIAPLMILLVGNARLGFLSLISNFAPILMGLGIMHWLGIPLDMFTMMVGSIAIGMAVDNTIHFMHGFRRYHEGGMPAPRAVNETLLSTGRALVITSLALSTGFFVQMAGTLTSVRNCGFIAGFTILAALLAALTLAPALVTLATSRRRSTPATEARPGGS